MSLLQEEGISRTFSDINRTEIFLGQSPKAIGKKKLVTTNQTYKILHSKGNHFFKKKENL